jgi:hypothetical protein
MIPTTRLTRPGRPITNAVEEAVFIVFGGPYGAADALGVKKPTIYAVLKEGCVRTKSQAERWEAATTAHGCTIPREELIGWAPWRGPERHDRGGPRNGRNRPPKAAPRRLDPEDRPRPHVVPAPAGVETKVAVDSTAAVSDAHQALVVLGIVRPPGVPARLLEAHARLDRPAAPSTRETRCSSHSIPAIVLDAPAPRERVVSPASGAVAATRKRISSCSSHSILPIARGAVAAPRWAA